MSFKKLLQTLVERDLTTKRGLLKLLPLVPKEDIEKNQNGFSSEKN